MTNSPFPLIDHPFPLIDQLIAQGVDTFCIAPGSRSAPLALAIGAHPKAHLHVHFDERGLSFFALGLARAKKTPVALVTTSGTAVGNLLPAVMEAHHSYTPLLLLTADRPAELRHTGANQTTDQVKIFSPFVRWQVDLPPNPSEEHLRSEAALATFYATQNPPGPVHLNCQFREPLYTPPNPSFGSPKTLFYPTLSPPPPHPLPEKGLLLLGPLPKRGDLFAALALAEQLQWPLFADLLSEARLFPTPEQILSLSPLQPDLVLHLGGRLTSKEVLHLCAPEWLHVSPYPPLQDPERCLTGKIQSDIALFCNAWAPREKRPSTWLNSWKKSPPPPPPPGWNEHSAMAELSSALPPDTALFLGNSMPIRQAEKFLFPPSTCPLFANRGLSGIDGNIATLAGLQEGLQTPLIAWIGDQTALHDLNSLPLLANRPIHLLIANNFGGQIFTHLPGKDSPHLKKLFVHPHSYGFEEAAKMFGLSYRRIEKEGELKGALASSGPALIELRFP